MLTKIYAHVCEDGREPVYFRTRNFLHVQGLSSHVSQEIVQQEITGILILVLQRGFGEVADIGELDSSEGASEKVKKSKLCCLVVDGMNKLETELYVFYCKLYGQQYGYVV